MKFLGIIPARYASTRFPGKPLADMKGKPLIQRVYEQVRQSVDELCIATDDERIATVAEAFGARVVMTSAHHRSGTDRCYEAYRKTGISCDVVINIQGDEPFIHPEQLELLKGCFEQPGVQIATLVKPLEPDGDFEQTLFNPNLPKVVLNSRLEALYFSRSVIPYLRGREYTGWLAAHTFYRHIGLYAYQTHVLKEIVTLPPSPLEQAESLEQLRWLENGYRIQTAITHRETLGIDTPEDLQRALKMMDEHERVSVQGHAVN
ncbi:MAG: 3-deoxy-manno-octulosonate cytidylyltransferase [Tannerella sp.]|jgi:3-deoxy-manno-octulosonate cytidylyltransferase (CMP-KDO synthetase)|nr:3-deoxy-manno-octulosonate cytidylyltransferase [Tannerella sp.]